MCGIAGWVGQGAAPPGGIRAMLGALEHRGPDDRGWHADGDATLGMTRLAIIDLMTGRQPMRSEHGDCLVFNGEVYNFRALRAELEGRGRGFTTRSDTEVILRAWQEWGADCVDRLQGMFAFAVWDARRRTLLLARDRLGKKPLYYRRRGPTLAFASEIKALLGDPPGGGDVDWSALRHYAAFGYTPGDRSIFADIAKLPPGHLATLAGGMLEVRRYWTLPRVRPIAARGPELRALVRDTVREAVRVRLESDVPLGVFLSGGVDSSSVVACMRELTGGRIATFAIGFEEDGSHDELPWARLVAERYGTVHHEEVLHPKLAELVDTVVAHFDEPFADSSAVPTLAVARATARHLKVALSGVGGDETFAGYPRYLGVRVSQHWYALPRALRAAPERLARLLARDSASSRNLGDWVRRFTAGAHQAMPERYIGWTRFFQDRALAALATPALARAWASDVEAVARAAWDDRGFDDAIDGAFRIDLATYLPDDLLAMADRMSMACSLELRAPFCDPAVVALSLGLPPGVKLGGLRLKGLLKDAFADTLPRAVRRRRKQGFMIPLARWLREDLRGLLEDTLAPELVARRGLWRVEAVERLKHEHLTGTQSHGDRLWALVMAELWTRRSLDRHGDWRLS